MVLLQSFRRDIRQTAHNLLQDLLPTFLGHQNQNAALDLRPFPRSFNKVSRDFNLSNRVSEIYHNVILYLSEVAGPTHIMQRRVKKRNNGRTERVRFPEKSIHRPGQTGGCLF